MCSKSVCDRRTDKLRGEWKKRVVCLCSFLLWRGVWRPERSGGRDLPQLGSKPSPIGSLASFGLDRVVLNRCLTQKTGPSQRHIKNSRLNLRFIFKIDERAGKTKTTQIPDTSGCSEVCLRFESRPKFARVRRGVWVFNPTQSDVRRAC